MEKALLFILFFLFSFFASAHKNELDSLLRELDNAIEHEHIYIAQKEQSISKLKQMLLVQDLTAEQKYSIHSKLYNEYTTFISDSALVYAKKKPANSFGT